MSGASRKGVASEGAERLFEAMEDCDRWGLVQEAANLREQYREMLVASLAEEAGAERVSGFRPSLDAQTEEPRLF